MQNQINLLTSEFYTTLESVGKYAGKPTPDRSKIIEIVQNKYEEILIAEQDDYKYTLVGGGLLVEDGRRIYFQVRKNGRRTYIPVVTVAEDGVTCTLNLNDHTVIEALFTVWVKDNLSKYKIREEQTFHIKKLFALVAGYANHFLTKAGFTGTDLVQVNQQAQKDYLNSCKQIDLYCYATPSLENHTFEQMNRLILECYAMQENSKSNSCMTKSGGDWTRCGRDFHSGNYQSCYSKGNEWIHPFQAYATRDWKFLFVSKHAPEQVLNWNKDKSPFIARAIAFNDNAYNKESEQQWYIRRGNVCYGAREIAEPVFQHFFKGSENTDGCQIKLYHNKYSDMVMPYVDGANQICGVVDYGYTVTVESTGEVLQFDVAQMGDNEGDEMYVSCGGYAIADRHCREVYCEVTGNDIPEDDAEWISELDGWVSSDFVNSDGELDGLAIFRYFRR